MLLLPCQIHSQNNLWVFQHAISRVWPRVRKNQNRIVHGSDAFEYHILLLLLLWIHTGTVQHSLLFLAFSFAFWLLLLLLLAMVVQRGFPTRAAGAQVQQQGGDAARPLVRVAPVRVRVHVTAFAVLEKSVPRQRLQRRNVQLPRLHGPVNQRSDPTVFSVLLLLLTVTIVIGVFLFCYKPAGAGWTRRVEWYAQSQIVEPVEIGLVKGICNVIGTRKNRRLFLWIFVLRWQLLYLSDPWWHVECNVFPLWLVSL